MSHRLDGRVIAVAGGAGNLGPTVVRRLAGEGAVVCVCGRDRESLDALADELAVEIETDVVDLLDAAATKHWAHELAAGTTAASTVSSTWSEAGAAASRSRTLHSRTGMR